MKKFLLVPVSLIILLACLCTAAFAQTSKTGTVKGRLIDSTSKEALKGATVSLLHRGDSSLVAYVLSQDNGSFTFDKVDTGKYIVHVSFQSYDNLYKNVTVTGGSIPVELGTMNMATEANELEGVIIKSSPPIAIKKDTVEFNAGSFKTKPNAVAEDLLKKLPGVEVDKDGSIKAQGEPVTRILVDGKRFFGDDPLMATKNLPPDVIDKIQIYDAQSDQSAFSGFDDGTRVKTINITIKKDKKKGYFGKASVGAGNKSLYEAGLNINRFKGDQQMSIIGQSNNVNKQGFSSQDFLGSGGGGKGGGGGRRGGGGGGGNGGSGGSNGLTKTWAGGLNYHDLWGPKTDIAGSYFYNKQNTDREQVTNTQILNTGKDPKDNYTQFNDSKQNSLNSNQNHRFNFNLEEKFDSNNALIFRPSVSYQQANNSSYGTTHIDRDRTLNVGNSTARSDNENSGYNANVDLSFRHKFKKGRTLSFALNGTYNSNDGIGNTYTEQQAFDSTGVTFRMDTINQRNYSNVDGKSYSATISYTEPVSEHGMLELNLNHSASKNNSDRRTYNFDNGSHDYTRIDSVLSNNFENTNSSNRATLNYRVQYSQFTASVGSGVQFSDMNSINHTKGTVIKQNFTNMYPTASLNYSIARQKSVRFNYDGRTAQPSVTQLQDVTDYSDLLNIRQGNPALKQSFNHNFRLLYNSFSQTTLRNVFFTFNASFTQNAIGSYVSTYRKGDSITGLPDTLTAKIQPGAQITRPVNLNGNYNMSLAFNYGFPIKSPKSNLNLGGNLSLSQSVNLQSNGDTLNQQSVMNYNKNYGLTGSLRWTTNLSKNFDVNFSSYSTYTISTFSLQPRQNGNYFSESLSTEFTYYTSSGWIASTDFDYKYYGRGAGLNTSVPLLNMSFAKQIFKDKSGEIKASVFDLLNQNVSVTRTFSNNQIIDQSNKVLTRYFLLTFTYNLRKFGGQKMPSFFRGDGGREGRGDGGGGFGGGRGGGGYGGGGRSRG